MVRLTSRLASTVAASMLVLTLAACSDSSDNETAKAPEAPATTAPATSTPATSTPATSTPATSTPATTAEAPAAATPAAPATDAAKPAAPLVIPTSDGDVDMAKLLEAGPLKDMSIGREDAPVTIVEYMSLTCGHCGNFHKNTFEPLVQKYIDTGKARLIVREFPLDPRAAAAIMLARCAPEEQFFPMVSVLFKQQYTWAAATDARAELLNIARLAGFTQESFEACLTNQKLLDEVNAVRNKGAEQFGVNATPTFIINGKRYSGDMSIDQMSAIIDPLL
jgi:protein-disulfide isomerase